MSEDVHLHDMLWGT